MYKVGVNKKTLLFTRFAPMKRSVFKHVCGIQQFFRLSNRCSNDHMVVTIDHFSLRKYSLGKFKNLTF